MNILINPHNLYNPQNSCNPHNPYNPQNPQHLQHFHNSQHSQYSQHLQHPQYSRVPYNMMRLFAQRGVYARLNRDYINMEAVFSDETVCFVMPNDPNPGDIVTIRLRTARANVDGVVLCIVSDVDGAQQRAMSIEKTDNKDIDNIDNIDNTDNTDNTDNIDSAETDILNSTNNPHNPHNPHNPNNSNNSQKTNAPDPLFDFYTVQLVAPTEPIRYYFALSKQNRVYYYNKRGLYDTLHPDYHFRMVPGFTAPDWARGALMYQIFVDRFCNGDAANDVVNYEYLYLGKAARALPWETDVPTENVCDFYGGDLQGIIDKLDYLVSLGVEALYLNPIFVSPSCHKYDIQDYDHVDPHFGVLVKDDGSPLTFEKLSNRYATKYISRTTDPANLEAGDALLVALVTQAHERGMRVVLDGVFNHCGSFNKWMDKAGFYAKGDYPPGAYRDANSPYRDYFLWYDQDWPNNDCYDGWWGNENHPKLNYESSPALYAYIMTVAQKWLRPPYNLDGWRLDVAADLGRSPGFNHRFWQDFRKAVKTANPQALILAEHYGDPSPWTNGGEWDSIMNYDAFMEPLTWFLTGMNKHSEESRPDLLNDAMAFENAMRYHMSRLNIHTLQTAMNELSNHDHSRFLTRTNRQTGRLHTLGPRAAESGVNKDVMMEAVIVQMTWPGAPTIYYGDEAGVAGWADPDNRRPYPWGSEDEILLTLHREAASLRRRYPMLRTGSVMFLKTDYGFVSFGRWDETAAVVVVLNNSGQAKDVTLPVWKLGCLSGRLERQLATYDGRVHTTRISYAVVNGVARLVVPACGAMVLARQP